MKTIKGIQINNANLKHWESLLQNWQYAINHYCNVMEGEDTSYFYTERANIGVLAVAGWKANWLSLQELSIAKRGKSIDSCDLYFYIEEMESKNT